jgi:AcrR family transcriptional regulator
MPPAHSPSAPGLSIPSSRYILIGMETAVGSRGRLTQQQRRAATRQRLLDAAARVFAERGYHGVSVDAVAEAAGFSKGAVYWHFASKEDLLVRLLETHCAQQLEAVEQMLAIPMPFEDRFRQVAQAYVGPEDQRVWCLLFVELWTQAMRDPQRSPAFARLYAATRAAVAELIEREADRLGRRLAIPSQQIAAGLLALGDGLMLQRLADPDRVAADAVATLLEHFFKGVLEPSPSRPPTDGH